MMPVSVSFHCPFFGSARVTKNGPSNGKQRCRCPHPEYSRQTFYAEYTYNAYNPDVKKDIIKMSIGGNGIRAAARIPGIRTDTVIAALKKRIVHKLC
jgi:transposase-like protein